jgi:hypothetical protein
VLGSVFKVFMDIGHNIFRNLNWFEWAIAFGTAESEFSTVSTSFMDVEDARTARRHHYS